MVDSARRDEDRIQGDILPDGDGMAGGNLAKALTQAERELDCSSNKLLNLEILMMQIAGKAKDLEAVKMEYEDISYESIEKALELDLLSRILDAEVNGLHGFITSLHVEFVDTLQNLCHDVPPEESARKIEENLHNAEESLRKLQDLVADIGRQTAKFGRTFVFCQKENRSDEGEELGNVHPLSVDNNWKLQNVDKQWSVLQMLEKPLAMEIDIQRKLSDSKSNQDKLKLKLHYAKQLLYCMEDSTELSLGRMFEAENAAEIFLGISRELVEKIHILQLNLNSLVHQEHDMRTKLQETMMKFSTERGTKERLKSTSAKPCDMLISKQHALQESDEGVEDKIMLTDSDVPNLREKMKAVEGQLNESDVQLHMAKSFVVNTKQPSQDEQYIHSNFRKMDNVIEDSNARVWRNEKRAEIAKATCAEVSKINTKLRDKVSFLSSNGLGNANNLERKLQESDSQLEHAKASAEAIEEHENILYAEIIDMENIIEDLKRKVMKAESRAQNAESKCKLLVETNLELNEELGFLRGRIDSLETSLHQAEDAKLAIAKDIGIRTKFISDLVLKLALERQNLRIQMSALTTNNKILSEKVAAKDNLYMSSICEEIDDAAAFGFQKSSGEALTDSSTANVQSMSSSLVSTWCSWRAEAVPYLVAASMSLRLVLVMLVLFLH